MGAARCCVRSKCMAIALLRWAVGLMFLVGGVAKLRMPVKGFVAGYLVPAFEKTFLPAWLVSAYGYALPFVETALGILLILGIWRNGALFLTGLTLISLAFGQMLIQGSATVANIMLYVLMTAVALLREEDDGWIPGCGKPASGGETEAGDDRSGS
jgi:thiosulfate dehydrogenase (quinone) large subunit